MYYIFHNDDGVIVYPSATVAITTADGVTWTAANIVSGDPITIEVALYASQTVVQAYAGAAQLAAGNGVNGALTLIYTAPEE